jgi:hypothetical protein
MAVMWAGEKPFMVFANLVGEHANFILACLTPSSCNTHEIYVRLKELSGHIYQEISSKVA